MSHIIAVRAIWLSHQRESGVKTFEDLNLNSYADYSIDQLGPFLSVAETLRKAAIERQILKHEETWRVPEDVELEPAWIEVPKLPETSLKILSAYTPEHSRDAGLDGV